MLLTKQFDVSTRLVLVVLILAALLLFAIPAHTVFAAQPNASCEDVGVRPGSAMNATGSAFNPNGVAGTKYAGEQPQNSKSTTSVSQYDVACLKVSQH